jgi:hypothetical protein
MNIRRISFVFALWCLGAASAPAASYTWTGNAPPPNNQKWSYHENWLPTNGPPGLNDTALIGSGSYVVVLDQPVTVQNLTIIGTTLEGTNALTVKGTLACQNATLLPAGGITVNGSLTIDPLNVSTRVTSLQCTMTISPGGSGNISSNGILQFDAAVSLFNNGNFTLKDGAQLLQVTGSGAAFVNNLSFFGGNAICDMGSSVFSNAPSGTVEVNAGATFKFQGTLASSGIFQADSGSVINISAATTALHDGASFTGSGNVLLTGSNNNLDGSVRVFGNVQFSGFALTLNGKLRIAAGGNFIWLDNALTGVGTNVTGTILVDASGTMLINAQNTLTLKNCIVTNNGTLNWTNGGYIFMGYNAQIANNGSFLIYGDGTLALLTVGTPGYNSAAIYNNNQVQKISGATNNLTDIIVPFHDTASLSAQAGKIQFLGGGDIGSSWSVTNGAVIQMENGNFNVGLSTFSASVGATNATIILSPSATLTIPATNNLLSVQSGCNFQQLGGTMQGMGGLGVVWGVFTWIKGSILLTNPEAIYVSGFGTMDISGGGNVKTIQAGGVVNDGVINWVNDNSGGSVYAGDNVVFENYGAFNIQCDAYLNDHAVTVHPVFTNKATGMIVKSALTGSSYFGFKTVNFGRVVAESGIIDFSQFDDSLSKPPSYSFFGISGAAIVLAGGSVTFDTPTRVTETIVGSGEISVSGGALTLTGNIKADAIKLGTDLINEGHSDLGDAPGTITFLGNNYIQMTNGTLVVPIRGTNAAAVDFGQLILQGYGQATLAGTLVAEITDGYAPPVGATFPFLTSFQRNGTFNNVILPQGMTLNYTPYGATLVVTGAVPVQIISPAVTNGQFQFGFNTISNRSYTVQYKDDLTAGAWMFLTNFTGDGSYWQAPPLSPLVPQRFFRVSNP